MAFEMIDFLDAVAKYSNATDPGEKERARFEAEGAFERLLAAHKMSDTDFNSLVRNNVRDIAKELRANERSYQ